jgi:hypothetical protein
MCIRKLSMTRTFDNMEKLGYAISIFCRSAACALSCECLRAGNL